ncbi:MAG: hypothetical protein R3B96_15250 [Pirellulaceae bacterium]
MVASNEYESVSYAVLKSLPGGTVMMLFYLAAFVCFRTSADSEHIGDGWHQFRHVWRIRKGHC